MSPQNTTALQSGRLAIASEEDLVFGHCPNPVRCGHGLVIGAGTVIPEINFTLPPIDINSNTWAEVRCQYTEMIEAVCRRAVELEVPGLLVEFETLPPMTVHPEWGAEITSLLAEALSRYHNKHGLLCALRLTPNDSRDHLRPPKMRSGEYWGGMQRLFSLAAGSGADMLAIESTGGKEVCDSALMSGDLRRMVFGLGVLAPRDMEFLWREIVGVCREGGIVPSGDTACGFANSAMAMAEQRMLPRVFAAIVRVASVPRGLVAFEQGAVGPSKDCAYEGPYFKAICGVPISMEGKSAACAHLSGMGNIAQSVCDCWSNESVQNVRLLSASAPVVSLEQLSYDCRLMNRAARSHDDALRLRDWLVDSDAALDPQAYVLRPDVAIRISKQIMQEKTPYLRTRRAALAALAEINLAVTAGELRIAANETKWLDRMQRAADSLPDDEETLIAEMREELAGVAWLPEEYGLDP